MKSPIFFSKGRTVRFWIQIVLVLALVRIALVPSALYANPSGEQVVGGAAGFNRPNAATLIVNQNSDRAVINWNSFSIANGELTRFVQPSSSSAVLNRVVTANPSSIYGTLQANGNVYLINPGGVLVGAGGLVNTASFVASTHDIDTEEFMKGGQLNLKGSSDASVINQGNITAREGDVFLIAKEVKNEGQLMAKDGTVGMVSGTEVSLQAVGQGNYKVRLMAAETDPTSPRTSQGEGGASKGSAEIVNEGVIQAANAVLEAKGSYLPMAIKNTGVIEATGLVVNRDGSVTLTGGEGDILNTGVVAALQRSLDGQRETGGSIMMTAKNVTSDLGAVITAAGRDGGGIIKIESRDTTMLAGRAEVTGYSDMARGGRAEILGRRVGLRTGEVNADGGAGGGTILVGGDYLGKNPTIQNAEATVLAPDASISASATKNGDGGRVILWSDQYTGSFGNIDAKGGIEGGNGGFVETSSKMNLSIFGFVDVGAPKGSGGAWLLDPADIEITGNVVQPANYSTLLTSPPFEPVPTFDFSAEILFDTAASPDVPVGLSQVSADLITFGLSQGNVRLQANNSIIVSSAIPSEVTIAPGSGSSPASTSPYKANYDLTLESGGYIDVNQSIEIYGNITLISNSGSATTGPTSPTAGNINVNGAISSINAGITLLVNTPTLANQLAGDVILNSTLQSASAGQTISISSPDGTITLNSNIITAGTGTLNLSTGSSTLDGGEIIQRSGTITAGTLNVTTQSDTPGAFIYLGTSQNDTDSVSLRTLTQNEENQSAQIYYRDLDGFNIDGLGIRTDNNVTLRGGVDSASDIGQINSATVEALGLGIVTGGSVTLTDTSNDIRNLAVDLRNPGDGGPGDLFFTDADGLNVAFVDTNFVLSTLDDTHTVGIRADDVELIAENGVAGNAFGIRLRNTPGDRTEVTADTQYLTLGGLPIDSPVSPGHIESAGNVTIIVRQLAGTSTGNFDNRFTLDEGIHLFAGMDDAFTGFDNTRLGSHGIVTIYANNMVIGMDTDPNLTMHGLIMTQNINQADTLNPASGVFLAPYGTTDNFPLADSASFNRGVQIVSAKADYDVTPDPGFFQLTNGELNRINTSRLQIRSAFTDTSDVTTPAPAIDVRSSLSMNGLYDISTISTGGGIFPNTPGVNVLELWASGGGSRSNVQVSADISSDATSTTSTTPTPMQIFLSAAVAGNGLQGGVVNVNAGLRSNGGNIALQGDNVNISGLINANNPNNANGLGLVAIFPAQTGGNINLGAKPGTGTLGILRDELALITAGTVQIGISFLSPKVLQPTNPFTETFLAGSNPLWQIGDLETLAGVNTGTITITDLIADLSISTLALLSDDSNGTGTALSQDTDAGIQVSGLFVGGAPGTDTAAAPETDYILGSNLNEIDRLGVALGTTSGLVSFSTQPDGSIINTTILGQDPAGEGAPTGDLFLVNSKGLVGGNSGEVARTVQQWDQGLVRANVSSAPLYTGIGLVVAEALSITAAGPVSIYETLPTGVTGVGQYMAHVSANPNSAAQMDRTEVGNEIGALGGNGTTVGLAVDARQNTPGSTGANSVWAAAARGLAVSDLSSVFTSPGVTGNGGIINNGGTVTLEGNAIEIAPDVARTTGGRITIDTTGDGIAPSGARVVIRPATGRFGFQNRAGSGAYDPNLQNSILAGAPVEMNLGTTSTEAGLAFPDFTPTFLNASLDTIWIGAPSLRATAIRASAIEIGQNSIPGTAAGKITVSDALTFNSLTQTLKLSSGGAVETDDNLAGGDTITLAGGLAVQSIGAVALRGNVDLFAVDTSGGTEGVRFIDSTGGITIANVDGVNGILAGSVFLETQVTGAIGQANAATIQATSLGIRSGGGIRLDQSNDVSLFAADATGSDIYLNTSTGLSISQVGAGAPGGVPLAVAGVRGKNITLVTNGNITQAGDAPVVATGAFLGTVAVGSSATLDSKDNSFAVSPLVVALTTAGALGSASDVTIVNKGVGGIVLGQAGVANVQLLTTGSGYTAAPTVSFSSGTANASPILGVGTITLSNNGSGYLSAPFVSITGGGGVGATAEAVVDLNALSSSYGQITRINITNAGTGYTTLPTVTLTGGSAAQVATVTSGTAATLILQRINLIDPGIGSNYTTTPTVTISGSGGSGATATATIGGVAGYVAAAASAVTGGITGNLLVINSGSGTLSDGNGFSVQGTSTFGSVGTITLDSTLNNMLGTITVGSRGSVTINNANSSIVGNFTGANLSGVPDSTLALGGTLTLGSKGSVYQASSGALLKVTGAASFYATTTALTGGTPNGSVILNNANNDFTSSVSAEGTRVVIRDSTGTELILWKVTASTSLAATSSSGGIIQTGEISSGGAASFAAAGASSINVGTEANTFSGTVSFAALNSGTLANVSVRDTTALDLQAMTLTGSLTAISGGAVTDSGALVIGGTTSVSAPGHNITLDNANQFTGAVNLAGANVTLNNRVSSLVMGTGSVSGNLAVTSTTPVTQSGVTTLTVAGTTSFSAIGQNITLNNANQFTGAVSLTGANVAVTDAAGLILGATTATGTLAATATTGNITQTGKVSVAANSTFTASEAGANIILDNALNSLNGTVAFAGAGGLANVTLVDTSAVDLQALTISENLSITSGGEVTDSGVLNIGGKTTISAVGQNITLDSANQFTGAVSLIGMNIAVTDASGLLLGTTTATGTFGATATTGSITQNGAISVTGGSTFTAANGANITLGNSANTFTGAVTFTSAGTLSDITLADTTAYQIQDGLNISGSLSLTAAGITQGVGALNAITVGGTTTLNGGTGAIVLTNSGNSYGGTVTVTGGSNADMFFSLADETDLGAVTTGGSFTLRTDAGSSFNIANGISLFEFNVDDDTLADFNVGTFAPIATDGGNLNLGSLASYPGVGGISLTTIDGGDINALGAINLTTLQLNSSGGATFSAVNQIRNLGNVTVAVGGLTLQNSRGLILTGTATMPGRLSLEVAGQFYNQTGQSQPLAGVASGSVIKSLSLAGGLPNLISGLAGFAVRYDGVMPTSGNVMSYAVSPLTMFAPSGTTIAGVNLSGTETGGGQLNTFFTGSDNLNWMISDFGRFEMPTVKPSGMDYILYPQRVEPETKTLPAATLSQLERELGRPPTLEEIQAREVAVREAATVRSGAILERNSFDAVDDEVDKQESAEVPVQVIDGGKPQAKAETKETDPKTTDSSGRLTPRFRGLTPKPMLRSGPKSAVATLRPSEPSQIGNMSEVSAQALKLDAKSVMEQERASAEVGIAPPIAAGR